MFVYFWSWFKVSNFEWDMHMYNRIRLKPSTFLYPICLCCVDKCLTPFLFFNPMTDTFKFTQESDQVIITPHSTRWPLTSRLFLFYRRETEPEAERRCAASNLRRNLPTGSGPPFVGRARRAVGLSPCRWRRCIRPHRRARRPH